MSTLQAGERENHNAVEHVNQQPYEKILPVGEYLSRVTGVVCVEG